MKRKWLLPVFCLFALLFAGCEKQPDAFDQSRSRMVGSWQMDTYTAADGATRTFWEDAVVFVYNADGTGKKTVGGTLEYTLTYSYDGKELYTTAAYPSTGKVQLRHDLCTATADTLTIYSYDEKATIVLRRITPAS